MKRRKAVSWMLSLMLAFTMIPALGAVAYAEDGGAPAIVLGAGNIAKGDKVYMGVRKISDSIVPISWIILGDANSSDLKNSEGDVINPENARLLITEKTQDNTKFRSDASGNNSNIWQESDVRSWCDSFLKYGDGNNYTGFQDRFSDMEKSTVLFTSKTDAECNAGGKASALENERLFLLSAEEVSDGKGYFNGNVSRKAYRYDADETIRWWLRSPDCYSSNDAYYVTDQGGIGVDDVGHLCAVRPAFNFDLTSVLFTSAADGVKPSASYGMDSLSAIPNNVSGEWKLTLHDSSRDDFAAQAGPKAVLEKESGYSDWSIPVVFSGANPGDNEYVSVILCDSNDNAIYYGNIAKDSAATTDLGQAVKIPEGLAAGNYKMYIFNEQINGDKLTDYASEFSTIEIAVKHTVTFDPNGGSGNMDLSYARVDEEFTVPECTFAAPDGKVFWRWNTLAAGTAGNYGTWYDPGDKITLTEDLTLYARWSEPVLSICSYDMTQQKSMTGGKFTYIFGGGNPSYGCNNYTLQLDSEYSVTAVPDDGYEFVGWYKGEYLNEDANGNPTQDARPYLDDENLITTELTYTFTVTDNMVLCPVFKKAKTEPEPQPAIQTITASNVTKTYGNASFSLGAKTNGDGKLTYKSSNTKVAAVTDGGKVTIKGAGTAKITISAAATASYKAASKTITITVKKAANPLKMKPKTASVKYKKLKKKTQTLAVTKVITFTKQLKDKKTYTLVSAKKGSKSFKKYFKINKTTGKVTIKKNKKMKKGTYKVRVKIQALGNSNYNASAVKTVTFKVKVK